MGTPTRFQQNECNHELTIFDSAARTATANSSDFENISARGIWLALNITAASGTTPTLDIKVQRKDPLSDTYYDVVGGAFAQKTGMGSDDLIIYPGITAAANRAVSSAIASRWRVVATIGGTTPSFTFSVSGGYIV